MIGACDGRQNGVLSTASKQLVSRSRKGTERVDLSIWRSWSLVSANQASRATDSGGSILKHLRGIVIYQIDHIDHILTLIYMLNVLGHKLEHTLSRGLRGSPAYIHFKIVAKTCNPPSSQHQEKLPKPKIALHRHACDDLCTPTVLYVTTVNKHVLMMQHIPPGLDTAQVHSTHLHAGDKSAASPSLSSSFSLSHSLP